MPIDQIVYSNRYRDEKFEYRFVPAVHRKIIFELLILSICYSDFFP